MIVDLDVGGVLIPGLLALVFVAIFATVAIIRVLRVVGIYRLFAHWPLVELAIFALIYGLLVQHLPSIGHLS
ncbi:MULTISPECIES: DUF1656 domain-containing protein [Pseudomonas]|jgi:hypothetical protein|uniref:DUF1656 domain-containing protein n=1 Tax=Pseudomonas TaxID=286 RepID=UPI0005C2D1A0|nr:MULTISPECIES: DUF1656 domain-containing protein [Pseudomonas]KIR18361.1 hypothetical protein PFLU4_12600 [Pseudomonas fluorescens]KAB0528385.1 DUF1656 domain-containing protein [Pseudomonas brassicacearum subsp. brassicacearum]NJP59407.1 DUF1656 domain-containing protein [Pseudomonas brassicacearum]PJH89856.1 DUF1656 domain-containing protein [Pseudomonas sp. WCS365]QEO78093.1 DUF1656 domain-containing protein [Pseudomonas brassicacearum]